MAALNGTTVQINGVPVATLAQGKFYQTLLSVPSVITANQPIHVTQYANSSDHDLVEKADPFMVQIQHKEQFTTSYKFSAAQDDFNDGFLDDFASNYVNVIAPTSVASANAVLLDGVPILAASFTPIGGTGFSSASAPLPLFNLVHTVTAPQPVGVIVYGWALFDSYAWPACFGFGDVKPPVLSCPDPASVFLGTFTQGGWRIDSCVVPLPDYTGSVVSDTCDTSSVFTVTQLPAPGTLVGPGVHDIFLSALDASGNAGTCKTTYTVVDPTAATAEPVIKCPDNITVECNSAAGAVVDYAVSAMAGCTPLEVIYRCADGCDRIVSPGSVFPFGTTRITCQAMRSGEIVASCSFSITVNCTRLSINRTGPKVSLQWQGGGVLQVADRPAGPWTDASLSGSQTDLAARDPQKFYRLRK